MIKEGCQCFTCRHRDEPRLCAAYLQGQIEACDWFLSWAKENSIQMGSVGDKDLSGLYAIIDCNRSDAASILSDMPDLEKED